MSRAPVRQRRGLHDLNPNQKFIYGLVRRAGQASRADLMRQSGLSFPSVSRIVTEFLEAGMLQEGTTRRGNMGKPPMDLSVNPEHGYSLGVYVGGDDATGMFVNVLGEPLKHVGFSASSLPEELQHVFDESGLEPDKFLGICLTTSGDPVGDKELEHLSSALGIPVYAEPAIAASVRAERYFGSASQLSRFLFFDVQTLELGALVNSAVLAQPGTLAALLGVQRRAASPGSDGLPGALSGAAALVQAEALVVSGLSAADLETLSRQVTNLPVVPASAQAGDPAWAAATVPLDATFGV